MSSSPQAGTFNVKAFFSKLFYHWPLYLVFLTICFLSAGFYLRYKMPVYQIFAKVMVKEPQASSRVALEALNLSESETNIDAQMGLMSSLPVIRQVVEDLQLWVTYLQPTQYYSYRDIYESTPVKFRLLASGSGPLYATINITIESDSTYKIKVGQDNAVRFKFNERVRNKFGTWLLEKNNNLNAFIGQIVQIRLRDLDDAVNYYRSNIILIPNTKSSTITLSFADEVPVRGKAILDDNIKVYMAASVKQKRESSQNTLKFVDERLGSITKELNNVESRYEGYKSQRGITEIANQSSVYLGSVQQNQMQLSDMNIKLSVLGGIERYLNSEEGKVALPSTLGIEDGALQAITERLRELLLEKTKMSSTLPETSPLFNSINQQINATRNSLREYIRTTRATLIATIGHLQARGSNFQTTIRSLPGQERDLVDIKRMQGIKENLYVYLLQKKEELSLDYASTISDAAVIEQGHSGALSAPIPKTIYAMAFLLGLILPTSIIYGRSVLKNQIVLKNEIIEVTGLPVLCELSDSFANKPIVVLGEKSFLGEQFRELRTMLTYLHGNSHKGKTTLFTSSIAGEGKSFVLSNLGTVLAVAGKKTILVELDLRRPTLSSRFSLKNPKMGITDYIVGNATQEQIIQPSGISPELDVICGGAVPPNPSELLESESLANLINDLKSKYDHILVDTPPVHLLTDAMIITHLCDITLFIVRYNFTPKQELNYIKEIYDSKKLPKLSIVFNAVSAGLLDNSYLYKQNNYIKAPAMPLKRRLKVFLSRF